jgi:hypothetical protein
MEKKASIIKKGEEDKLRIAIVQEDRCKPKK